MIEDVRAALLGDHEAARRLTEAGVLLPCAHCGGHAVVQCKQCGIRTVTHRQLPMERWQDVDRAAIEEWNTRAPILSAEEMEKIYGKEDS